MKKDLLTLLDLEKTDFDGLFQRAIELKDRRKQGNTETKLNGKSLGLIFDKPSTRTRVSFETAMIQMGGVPLFISTRDTQVSRNEPVMDTARVLSRYLDGIVIRTFSQDLLEEFAAYSAIPVINALTDLYHPTQVLSDLMTIIECKGGYDGITVVWVGDGNNVSHSWINAAAVLGFNLNLACPVGYFPNKDILNRANGFGQGRIRVITDPVEAMQGADVIYTDVWASMGQESESIARKRVFKNFQVNNDLICHAKKDAIVMHCLPAHRGEEISEALLECQSSVVWDQSENKLHMNKAILEAYMCR
ncbi:MAG: ornithine carbamoyltransferase [Desulfatirhabdiaceae bacterium]